MNNYDMSKRYWVFAGPDYYPSGGMHDIVGTFDHIEDAFAEAYTFDWYWILDVNKREWIQ